MHRFERETLTVYGLAAALILMIASASIAYRSVDRFAARAALVQHSHVVINQTNVLLSELKDAETGSRGYLLTRDKRFLEPYEQAVRVLPAQLQTLKALTRDNAGQQQAIAVLGRLTAQQLAILREGIALEPQIDHDRNAKVMAIALQGKRVMDEIRAVVGHMAAGEEQILRRRTAAENSDSHRTKRWVVLGSLAAIALLLAAFWALHREIRKRKAAQEQAEKTALELADLYNNAPCAYHSVDAQGVITRINDTELAWLGYTRDEIVGKMRHPDLMTPESAERYRQTVFPLFQEQGWLKDVEFEYVRKDGSILCGALNATVVRDAQGRYVTSRTSLYDITDRKQTELRIRQLNAQLDQRAAELEMTNKELESFSYSVSHDLRSPLRAIDGFSRMLEEDYADRLDDEGRRILQVIRDNSKKMGQLIDDLLAFSRLGRKPIEAALIDMDALVDEVWSQACAEARGGARDAAPRLRREPLPAAWGDAAMIRQVLANLVSNAIKYSSRQAEPVVEISGSQEGTETLYQVRDNGVGFDMQYYNKLFRVFQRLHGADEFPGTGVGLAIVQRVVVRHGGRVWAQSEPGVGSIFTFSLPKKETT
jgi:PAS domain S-box-containing protein